MARAQYKFKEQYIWPLFEFNAISDGNVLSNIMIALLYELACKILFRIYSHTETCSSLIANCKFDRDAPIQRHPNATKYPPFELK